eukprot:CAMPEP_0197057294 /NCGR_PEP_ID=MMETSP1384-20130603/95366_1 /TAXON_ID=29189 /ORGANISM="Ammonia sp." /LENGTH=77 /DNA_ID=CAMNT_0042491665 /DNA_START=18 /DNA_END=251 /DNA_ORIENTATION=-
MASRRRKGNTKHRLQKQLEEQRRLEHELEQLNSAQSDREAAKEILEFVQKHGGDPMTDDENNYFANAQPVGCSCVVL